MRCIPHFLAAPDREPPDGRPPVGLRWSGQGGNSSACKPSHVMIHGPALLLFSFLALMVTGGLIAEQPERKPDIHYVPTPEELVQEMLSTAKVGKDDVVYDLGCGDGRIVIMAAQKYGARG